MPSKAHFREYYDLQILLNRMNIFLIPSWICSIHTILIRSKSLSQTQCHLFLNYFKLFLFELTIFIRNK